MSTGSLAASRVTLVAMIGTTMSLDRSPRSSHPAAGRDRPLVIECVGLPGAGKTTVRDRLLGELIAEGVPCSTRPEFGEGGVGRLLGTIAAPIARRDALRSTMQLLHVLRPYYAGRIHLAWKLASWPARWNLARRRGTGTVLLDEGLVQNLCGVLLGADAVDMALVRGTLGSMLPSRDVSLAFIWFDINMELAVERCGRRADAKRIDRATPGERTRLLRANGGQLREALDIAIALTGALCLHVNGARPVEETLADVRRFTFDLLSAG